MSAPAPIVAHQEVVKGDDYKAAEGRALTWFSPQWPNLASCVLSLVVGYDSSSIYGSTPVTWKQTLPATTTRVASLELTAAQTKELSEGQYDYTLKAEFPDKDIVTLAIGKLTVYCEPGQAPLWPAH